LFDCPSYIDGDAGSKITRRFTETGGEMIAERSVAAVSGG
jgi:hypothetical protein